MPLTPQTRFYHQSQSFRITSLYYNMSAKSRKRSSEYHSDEGFVVDDDGNRPKKVKKLGGVGAKASSSSSSNQRTDTNGDIYWEISSHRRITISDFRGKSMVNIREYYEKDGQELPGKKVIFLSLVIFFISRRSLIFSFLL